MARVPVLAIALVLASVGITGFAYLKTRPVGSPAAAANAEIVVDGSNGLVEYMHMAILDGHLPAGKSWVKIDVGALGKKLGVDLSKLQQGDSADPAKMFELLRPSANPPLSVRRPSVAWTPRTTRRPSTCGVSSRPSRTRPNARTCNARST